MAIEARLALKQRQQLVMTPALQMAILDRKSVV